MAQYLSPGVYVEEVPSAVQAIAGVGTSTAGFIGVVPDRITVLLPNPDYDPTLTAAERSPREERPQVAKDKKGQDVPPSSHAQSDPRTIPFKSSIVAVESAAGDVRLCTNFSEFKRSFGDFSTDPGQSTLAQAVFGFFNNGGSRCYVVRVGSLAEIGSALEKFEAIDEIALVVAPGVTEPTARAALMAHCEKTGDRFAILDSAETEQALDESMLPDYSKNGAFYFPWIL